MKTKICLLMLLTACVSQASIADVTFGRLYTTPKQREQLDAARNKIPQDTIIIDITESAPAQTETAEDTNAAQSITLDGIVYRSDGKNTAWINRNSTNEGNLETQFTKVEEKDVHSNQVKITLPDNQTRIDLKVGQQYDINSKEITDTMKDPATTNPSTQPEQPRPSR